MQTLAPLRMLVLSWSIPHMTTGAAVVMGNLATQFRRDEMTLVGAYDPSAPTAYWQKDWPRLRYAMLQPPDAQPGARWIRWVQFPFVLLLSLWLTFLHRRNLLFAVYPDQIFLLAAYCVSLATGLPLVAYFHNTYVECRPTPFARWLQERVFNHAKIVFVMSEGMAEYYREQYPDLRCVPLIHTHHGAPPNRKDEIRDHARIQLAFAGNINGSCSEAFARIVHAIKSMPDVHCTIYGHSNRKILEAIGVTDAQFTLDRVPYTQLIERLQSADILLLPHGFHGVLPPAEYRTIFPTKTIEYLYSCTPILAHAPADSYIARFLQEHECAYLVTVPDVDHIKQAIHTLHNDLHLRHKLMQNARQTARRFDAALVAAELRRQLASLRNSES